MAYGFCFFIWMTYFLIGTPNWKSLTGRSAYSVQMFTLWTFEENSQGWRVNITSDLQTREQIQAGKVMCSIFQIQEQELDSVPEYRIITWAINVWPFQAYCATASTWLEDLTLPAAITELASKSPQDTSRDGWESIVLHPISLHSRANLFWKTNGVLVFPWENGSY